MFTPVLGNQAIVGQTAEGVEFASQDTAVTFQEDTIVKFAGANVVNVELLDRSDPSFLDLLIRELAASYAQKTDAYAAKIASEAAAGSSGSTIYAAIADGIADAYGVMRFTPNRLMVAPSGGEDGIDFAGLLGAVADGRPLFAAAAPQNAAGLISQGSTAGSAGWQFSSNTVTLIQNGFDSVDFANGRSYYSFFSLISFNLNSFVLSHSAIKLSHKLLNLELVDLVG